MSKWGLEFASSARAMAAPSRPTDALATRFHGYTKSVAAPTT
jgi:hypothetical protein